MDKNITSNTWRVITTPPASGARNMAVDEAILEEVSQKRSLPTLRLYAWDPPCISLGYAQPIADIDIDALSKLSWQVVRRPTGGRAILHSDELTYSVIAPIDESRMSGGILESYQRLSRALLLALQMLNIPVLSKEKYDLPKDSNSQGPVCFEVPSNWEITLNGKKLIGSAQVRRKSGVLQHGSLPLYGDLTRITRVLSFPDSTSRQKAASRLLKRATTIESATGKVIPWELAAEKFVEAFQEELKLVLIPSKLSDQEQSRTNQLLVEKYDNQNWTNRV